MINTGYYSDRIKFILNNIKKENKKIIRSINEINWNELNEISGNYMIGYFVVTLETSIGMKLSIDEIKKLSKKTKSKIILDATGSIGLENNHNLADVITFSSCKGLFGLTGASFICFIITPANKVNSFYLDINTHLNKKTTGPYSHNVFFR